MVAPGPKMFGLQLAGDSMFLRLGKAYADNKGECRGYQRSWGLCTSGQTTEGLVKQISKLNGKEKTSLIVMIGTNDVLNITKGKENLARERHALTFKLKKLRNILKRKCGTVYWFSIPPIPLLEGSLDDEKKRRYRRVLETVNTTVGSFDGDQFKVIRVGECFFDKEGDAVHRFFERSMGVGTRKRVDQIHWNDDGIRMAINTLEIHLNNLK